MVIVLAIVVVVVGSHMISNTRTTARRLTRSSQRCAIACVGSHITSSNSVQSTVALVAIVMGVELVIVVIITVAAVQLWCSLDAAGMEAA